MQDSHGDDERAEEPVSDIDVFILALHDGAEEQDGIADPHDCNQDIDWPFELGVFLRTRQTHRQGYGGCYYDCLPAPEDECR